MTDPSPPYVRPVHLEGAPTETVAQVTLGATCYLADPLIWAREGAGRVLALYLAQAPELDHWWYTTSRLTEWSRVQGTGLGQLVEGLSSPALLKPRHLFSFRLVDDPTAPGAGFHYQEVDDRRSGRASYLQLFWPQDQSPSSITRVIAAIAERWPLYSALCGHLATFNPHEKNSAFWQIYFWCRRYLGLDAQDPEAAGWCAATGLLGTSWLTLLGEPLLEALELDPEEIVAHPWKQPVQAGRFGKSVLIRAGSAPTLGDVNRLEYPDAYAEVARFLEPHLCAEPPELRGGFWEEKRTVPWLRRLIDPSGWSSSAP